MFRIRKLDIFIAKQFGLLFMAAFVICQFVLMMQFLWRYVDELIGKGLSMDILAQFFWYMGLMLMPQAFPLAILLSSLISFGNLGESSELTAIKAAGISLMQAMRSLIVIVIAIACVSFYFQEVIGPRSFISFQQLLLSMKQKNPEVEIPEGIFYDGIPNCNLYVQKKDMDRGVLYGIMIYRMNGGYEDAAVILADSGRIQATAEKKHLLLTLYSGEWFENMRQSGMNVSANIPYRRETFSTKKILLDFDGGFNLAEMGGISADARSKGLGRIIHDLDSIREFNDSVGHQYYYEAQQIVFSRPSLSIADSAKARKATAGKTVMIDSLFEHLTPEQKQRIIATASSDAGVALNNMEFKADYSEWLNKEERLHRMEAINKFTLSLSCIIFFFIGAPLGAIIRKGGLGVPVIISVMVFIVFYILDNTGMRMARIDEWTVWFGKLLGTAVLSPIAIFFTYKANKDSTVFNVDLYKSILMRMLGLRTKRSVMMKEVIIEEPKYEMDAQMLTNITLEIKQYAQHHNLLRWPNPIRVFFHPGDDHEIEHINGVLEVAIEDLSYSRNKHVIMLLNEYPIIATHAHTRPFRHKWLNVVTGVFLPTGIFFYFRMIRFRFRLYKDLQHILQTNEKMTERIHQLL
ncbi:lipopolysaccharide export system permease protein [Prevotellaceae bacterium HUN156]|nr:lipopolysaccharide export system permease protein [Prevotellaceae bacterium HUN156]